MSKRIVRLDAAPYGVRLETRPFGVSIDERTGNILLDEGEHGFNSAVIPAYRRAEFAVAAGRLVIRCAGREFDLGELADGVNAAGWVLSVNALLRDKVPPARPDGANGHAPAAAPVPGGRP